MVPVGASLPLIVRFADSPQEKAQKQLRSQVADSRYAMLDPTMTVPFHVSRWGTMCGGDAPHGSVPAVPVIPAPVLRPQGRALVPTWVRQMPAPHLRTASGAIPTRVIVSCLPRYVGPVLRRRPRRFGCGFVFRGPHFRSSLAGEPTP